MQSIVCNDRLFNATNTSFTVQTTKYNCKTITMFDTKYMHRLSVVAYESEKLASQQQRIKRSTRLQQICTSLQSTFKNIPKLPKLNGSGQLSYVHHEMGYFQSIFSAAYKKLRKLEVSLQNAERKTSKYRKRYQRLQHEIN